MALRDCLLLARENKKNHYSGKSSNILTAVLIFKINITSERQMAIRYPQI